MFFHGLGFSAVVEVIAQVAKGLYKRCYEHTFEEYVFVVSFDWAANTVVVI